MVRRELWHLSLLVLSLDGSMQNQDRYIETATTFRNEGQSVDQYAPIA
jgi:hypothetical protein